LSLRRRFSSAAGATRCSAELDAKKLTHHYLSSDDLYVAAVHAPIERIVALIRDAGKDPNRSDQHG